MVMTRIVEALGEQATSALGGLLIGIALAVAFRLQRRSTQ